MINIFRCLRQTYYTLRLWNYRRNGLQISKDAIVIGAPNFGSEPYLISIAEHVLVSGNVQFITHDGAIHTFTHNPDYKLNYPQAPKFRKVIRYGRITVNENCFIGFGAIILPGVSIGPNSIVAAGSVVTNDVTPNHIFGGNPAKLIGEVDDFAEKCLRETPNYDEKKYYLDKKGELLRIYPYPW